MKKTLTNSDIQKFLQKGYNPENGSFQMDIAKNLLLQEREENENKKAEIEEKIQLLEKFTGSETCKKKSEELYRLLDETEKAQESHFPGEEVNDQILRDYLLQKQHQISRLSSNIQEGVAQENDLKYQDLFLSFGDDEEFLQNLQTEKESSLQDTLQKNTKLGKLATIEELISQLSSSFTSSDEETSSSQESENIDSQKTEEELMKELIEDTNRKYKSQINILSWLVTNKKDINDAYEYFKDSPLSEIKIKEIKPKSEKKSEYLRSKSALKALSYIFPYYSQILLTSSRARDPLSVVGDLLQTKENIQKYAPLLEDMTKSFEKRDHPDSLESLQDMYNTNGGEKGMEERIKQSEEKMALNIDALRGVKHIRDTYDNLFSTLPDESIQKILAFLDKLLSLGNERDDDSFGGEEENTSYTYYNDLLSSYGEKFGSHQEEFEECTRLFFKKSPRKTDKIIGLHLMRRLIPGGLSPKMECFLTSFFDYQYEELIADLTKSEAKELSCLKNTLSGATRFFGDLALLQENYPQIYQDIYGDCYNIEMLKILEEVYELYSQYLGYGDALQKTKEQITAFSHQEEKSENGCPLEMYKDVIAKNIHDIPYNDSIIVLPPSKSKNKQEYILELYRVASPHYLGVLRFNPLDKAIEREKFNQILADIPDEKRTISQTKEHNTSDNLKKEDDVISVKKFDENFGLLMMLHTNGELSLNGINEDGLSYVLGDDLYDRFQHTLLKNIAECLEVIDCRGGAVQQSGKFGIHDQADIHRKDPRKLYDTESLPHGGTKNLFYRKEHIRLLHQKMIVGYAGWKNAKESGTPLFACIYDISANPALDDPKNVIRIDDFSDEFQEVKEEMMRLRKEHNSDETFIRFQTYVDEFLKEGETHQGKPITLLDTTKQVETVVQE